MNVIYTAIFGDYDDLKEPLVITPGWDYLCITDQPFKSKVWTIITKLKVNNPVSDARFSKMFNYNLYDNSIWVDGSFTINCNLNKFWEKNFVSPMTVVSHPIRDCVYDEAEVCIKNGRGNMDDIAAQAVKYRAGGLPRNNGLIQSGILLRESTKEVEDFCELWWKQIELSTRDQIGFAYAEFRTGIRWPRINFDYRASKDFIFTTHKHRRNAAHRNYK